MADSETLAVARRAALRRAMDLHGVNPTDLARLCGWDNPNRIYNFIHGRSKSLDFKTLQELQRVMPGVTIDELGGAKLKRAAPPVVVKTYCQGGTLRDQFSVPANQLKELPLPLEDSARQAGAFAAIVKHPGAEEIYPEKTILLCCPADRYDKPIFHKMRFIVERWSGQRVEVTVREAQQDSEGRFWLSQRSTEPKLAVPVKMPDKISSKMWTYNHEKFALAGVVIGAFVPEAPQPGAP